MSWERRGKNFYYYHKFKSSDKVCSIYGGSGERGELFATWASTLQMDRDSLRDRSHAVTEAERRLIRSVEQRLIDYYNDVETLFLRSMEAAGYYLHRRQWRRKGRITMANRDQIPSFEAIGAALRAEQAKRTFDNSTDQDTLITYYKGDPSKTSFELLIYLLSHDEFQREAFRRQAQKRREELAGPDPSPIERTLAARAVICAFDLSYCDICVLKAYILEERATAALYDRRRHRAQKRYVSALKALETVRRVAAPDAQTRSDAGVRLHKAC
jgi:hypothetical protein